jgi:hypothetical protein
LQRLEGLLLGFGTLSALYHAGLKNYLTGRLPLACPGLDSPRNEKLEDLVPGAILINSSILLESLAWFRIFVVFYKNSHITKRLDNDDHTKPFEQEEPGTTTFQLVSSPMLLHWTMCRSDDIFEDL